MSLDAVLIAAEEGNALPVVSVVFPLIALGIFTLLGAVTWSYRDVAHRHSLKTRPGTVPRDPAH